MKKINVLKPTYDEQTKKELLEVLDSGWTGNGPKTREFEQKFAEYVGAKYAVATNSATSALDLCIKAYGIKGGELITTPMTFVADAIVGEWNGMDVTFADIDPDTLNLDPEALHLTLPTEQSSEDGLVSGMVGGTKVIIAVDSHGRLADIQGIQKKCEEAGISPLIIEDAAHAMYVEGAGKYAHITVWSFQAVKTLPIFDGGMITTNDETIAKKLRTLTWLGVEKSTYDRVGEKGYTWKYDITQADGIKGYMTDVQAVIGIGQLRRLETMLEKRRKIQARYNEAFKDKPYFKEPAYSHTVQYYTPQWINRDGLCDHLAEHGIHTSVHFQPLNETTYWKKAVKHPLPNTEVWKNLLSLPVHDDLSDEDVEYVISTVKAFYENHLD